MIVMDSFHDSYGKLQNHGKLPWLKKKNKW